MTSHFLACLLPCSTRACGRQWRTRTRWLSRACCPKTTSTVAWGEGGACGREKIGKRRIGWKRGREGWTGWVTRVWFPSMLLPLPTIPLCSTCCQRQEQDIILFVSEPSEKKTKKQNSSRCGWDATKSLTFFSVSQCANPLSGNLNWMPWWRWPGSRWRKGRWNWWRSRGLGHRPRRTSTGKSACGASGCSCTVGWGRTSSRQVSGLGSDCGLS